MDKEMIISQLRRLKPLLVEKFQVKDIALFGSYSRGDADVNSDIDILIKFENPDYDTLFHSFNLLQETFGDKVVQVVSMGGIKPQYLDAIKQDLIYA